MSRTLLSKAISTLLHLISQVVAAIDAHVTGYKRQQAQRLSQSQPVVTTVATVDEEKEKENFIPTDAIKDGNKKSRTKTTKKSTSAKKSAHKK